MPWIRLVAPEEAVGQLAREYEQALERAGRIWNIVSLMSPNPAILRASIAFYQVLMHGPSALSRGRREMLATVTARTIGCRY